MTWYLLFFGIIWLPSIIYLIAIVIVSIFSERFFNFGITYFLIFLGVIGIIFFGIRLMVGYYRHSRGKLDKKKVDRLWVKTICFNATFFFPSFYLNLQCSLTEECFVESFHKSNYGLHILSEFPLLLILLTVWWGLAIILSFTAVFSIKDDEAQ